MAPTAKKTAAKKRVRSTPDNRLTVDQLVAKAEKEFGEGIIITGAELRDQTIPRVSCGSLALDVALGGGFPINQWNEIIGEPSSGKTTIAMATVAYNQQIDPEWRCLWLAAEHFVAPWAAAIGCDLSRIHIINTNVIEDAFEIVLDWLDNRACDCIVIDSLPAMVSRAEDELSMEDSVVGINARLNGKFFRKANPLQKRSLTEEDRPCTLIIINQWREKIGIMFGDPRTTPGGKSKDYACFTRIETKRDEWIKHDDERVGIRMAVHSVKNKSAPVGRLAIIDFYFAEAPGFHPGMYDTAKDIVNTAIYKNIIVRGTPRYSYGERAWSSMEKLLSSVREDLDLQQQLRTDVLQSEGIGIEDPEPDPEPKPPRKPAAAKKAPAKRPLVKKR